MKKTNLCLLDEIFEISNLMYDSKFSGEAFASAKPHIRKLKKAINIPEKELVYFTLIFSGILCYSQENDENYEKINFVRIAKFVDVPPVEILKDYESLKSLYERELYSKRHDDKDDLDSFFKDELTIPQDVFSAVIENDIPAFKNISSSGKMKSENFILPTKIEEKKLLFEKELEKQIEFVTQSVETNRFLKLKKNLSVEKMNIGVCVLFYGPPGTGKTESVMQIAKTTGRAILRVDISAQRSKWWGRSEALTQKIFTKYNTECERAKAQNSPIPILLFNEADAVISKRKKNDDSDGVAETKNTIQNIILENMERFEGILFATTNLAENFDKAFERRFLFKVKFEKPTVEIAAKIWQEKIQVLDSDGALMLARQYDFSGGEIDNVARKIVINKVLHDEDITFNAIEKFCEQEKLDIEKIRHIGFGAG